MPDRTVISCSPSKMRRAVVQLAVPQALPRPLDVGPAAEPQAGPAELARPLQQLRLRRTGEHRGRRQRRRAEHLQLVVVVAAGDVERLGVQAARLVDPAAWYIRAW